MDANDHDAITRQIYFIAELSRKKGWLNFSIGGYNFVRNGSASFTPLR
jgi:hypothetical protein